jgi:nucleotide-binding universal stress UspA family protein
MNDTIVVGLDGSAASAAALRWAVEHAGADHRTVTAVEVQPPARLAPGTSYMLAPYGTTPPPEHTHSLLHETVTAVREAMPDTPNTPEITELRLRGDAGIELARVARNATMLVLGHNPHGKTVEFLFGRVTAECLRHADVPVVLVPASTSP